MIAPCFKCCGIVLLEESDIGDTAVDEQLPHFFDAVRGDEAKAWYAAELYERKICGIVGLDVNQMEWLRKAGKLAQSGVTKVVGKSKRIKRDPRYQILSDDKYVGMFDFESLMERPYKCTPAPRTRQASF